MWRHTTYKVGGTLRYSSYCDCPYCDGCQSQSVVIDVLIDAHDEEDAASPLLDDSQIIPVDIHVYLDDLLEQLTFEALSENEAVYQKNLRNGHPTLFDVAA